MMLMLALTGCDGGRGARSAQVDTLFAGFADGIQPGYAVLVIDDGNVVHEQTYGYADLETARRLTPTAPFRLASVSKQFTTMAIMRLAEDGVLDYDDPVSRWLPSLAAYEGVTLRHLMLHTAGLPDYYDSIPDDSARLSNADVERLLAERAEPVFPPGERYEYSNSAYEMLANVVAAASGTDFATFMRERLFMPAGMTRTLVHDHHWPEVPERVYGYARDGEDWELDDDSPLNGIVGSGSLFAPLVDFERWDAALRDGTLVSHDTLAEAWTPAATADGESTDYGFGWSIEEYRGRRRVAHGGSWVGFRTHIARYPDDGLTIVLLANRADTDPGEFIDPISDIYFER